MRVWIALVAAAALWAVTLTATILGRQPSPPAASADLRRLVSPLAPPTPTSTPAGGYAARCARCHGADGTGAAPRTAGRSPAEPSSSPLDLTRTAMRTRSDGEIYTAIVEGRLAAACRPSPT